MLCNQFSGLSFNTVDQSSPDNTKKRVGQLACDCSILIKVFGSKLENAAALNICWESFVVPVVILDLNMN